MRLLIIAEKFTFLFLLMILFNAYEFAYFLPGMETFSKTQNYIEPYRFNIILMTVGAVIFAFFAVACDKLLRKKGEFNLINFTYN
ncbi:hypothetical protein [Methanosarcina barkeri]|uniref:Uncharacterized protein n=1 Tax=Methanosarcina barkeri 227 TaxID=1434106 RepID=A0A0E3R3B7_METBA|nr:hypothetical protein [Methanosarcina barkeri]AKB57975.1 hypothetical protein MSBR2_1459 [Methanosarcina barkeri 227]